MTKSYFPFDNADVYEAQWSKMFSLLPTGVISGINNELVVYANSTGMNVKVKSGSAYIKGHTFESTAEETLSIAASDPTNPRWDLVVVKLDWVNNIIDLAVKTGTPAGSPVLPSLTQTTSVWEIALAKVVVDATITTIAANKVTGLRLMANIVPESTWVPVSPQWTYASTNTINVPSGAALIFNKGDKIKITQSGNINFFNVVLVADALLTVIGGSDYTVANSAISDIYYSKAESPIGFPERFSFTPTITAQSGTFTSVSASGDFRIFGGVAWVKELIAITTNGSAAGYAIATLPVNAIEVSVGCGRETTIGGKQLQTSIVSGDLGKQYIYNYDNTYPGSSGAFLLVETVYFI